MKAPIVRRDDSSPGGGDPVPALQKRTLSAEQDSPVSSAKEMTSDRQTHSRAKRSRISFGTGARSLQELLEREAELDRQIAELRAEGLSVEELDEQIDLLHRYNDVKDAAQVVMGRLAELESVTVRSLHEKYGAPAGT